MRLRMRMYALDASVWRISADVVARSLAQDARTPDLVRQYAAGQYARYVICMRDRHAVVGCCLVGGTDRLFTSLTCRARRRMRHERACSKFLSALRSGSRVCALYVCLRDVMRLVRASDFGYALRARATMHVMRFGLARV